MSRCRDVDGGTFTDGAERAEHEESTMLRKLGLVAVAAASLAAAALAPTTASAWGGHGWHGGWRGGGFGWGGPRVFIGGPALCLRIRIQRLLCAAIGPDPLGPALAPGQPLLLITLPAESPGALVSGLSRRFICGNHSAFMQFSLIPMQSASRGKQFPPP